MNSNCDCSETQSCIFCFQGSLSEAVDVTIESIRAAFAAQKELENVSSFK